MKGLKSIVLLSLWLLPLGYRIQAQEDQSIEINFVATVGDAVAQCGHVYEGIGADDATIQFSDFRFFVSNVRLKNSAGEETPLILEQDGMWQTDNVALLDFEDGSATCSEIGNAALNGKITGTAPAGDYTAIVFDLGVPFELNHQDVTLAASPLNVAAMWWNWQGGYKFVRVDLTTDAREGASGWFIHVGSTACESPAAAIPPLERCTNPNLTTITLADFDFENDVVVADLAGLLAGVALYDNTPMPPGCMSGIDDPDCAMIFPNFGLSLADGICLDGNCDSQTFFSLGDISEAHLIGRSKMEPEMHQSGDHQDDHSGH